MTLPFMLSNEYNKGMEGSKKDLSKFSKPPIGWYMSEKYDGYRACYNHEDKQFYSRQNKLFNAPVWFLSCIPPNITFDGELWAGRDNFQLMGTVRKKKCIAEEWIDIQFQTYDIITNNNELFIDRIQKLQKIINWNTHRWKVLISDGTIPYPMNNLECPIRFTKQIKIKSLQHMNEYYQSIIKSNGEGIMIKHPLCPYINGRTSYLLKYKPAFDRECIVIGYKDGKNKYIWFGYF